MPAIPPRRGPRFRWWASIALLLTAATPLAPEIPAPPPAAHPSAQEVFVPTRGSLVVTTGATCEIGPGETPREAAG